MSTDQLSSLSLSQAATTMVETVTSCGVMLMETAAQSSLGQTIFHLVDRFVWVVEKSLQWSLPTEELIAEENGKTFGKIELIRPLPWIFFLVVLINLRIYRMGLNIGSLILGYPRIETAEMVRFLQKVRRRLRAIKTNGMKSMRQRKSCTQDNDPNMNGDKWRSSKLIKTIQMTLSSLSCLDSSKLRPSPPPTKIKVHINNEFPPTVEEQSTTESTITVEDPKRKYSELSSDEECSDDSDVQETIQAKIDRLAANDDSMDDDEFNPGNLSSPEDDAVSNSDGETDISTTELEALRNEANSILHRTTPQITEVKAEEKEQEGHVAILKNTGEDEKLVDSNAAYSSGNGEEFYSPLKLGDDGESTFYSPISSTSASPDRTVPNIKDGQHDKPVEKPPTEKSYQNGEQDSKSERQNSGISDETTNGHTDEKLRVPTNVSSKNVKSYHRGRRANHASRKKK